MSYAGNADLSPHFRGLNPGSRATYRQLKGHSAADGYTMTLGTNTYDKPDKHHLSVIEEERWNETGCEISLEIGNEKERIMTEDGSIQLAMDCTTSQNVQAPLAVRSAGF